MQVTYRQEKKVIVDECEVDDVLKETSRRTTHSIYFGITARRNLTCLPTKHTGVGIINLVFSEYKLGVNTGLGKGRNCKTKISD